MFCEVLEIYSGVTTCPEVISFSEKTNFLELTVLLVAIVSLTGIACIEAICIRNTCNGDDFTRAISIEVAASASIRGAYVKNID